MRSALRATDPALGALAEGHLGTALLCAVGQDAPLEGSYLPPAGGALFGELSHDRYGSSARGERP